MNFRKHFPKIDLDTMEDLVDSGGENFEDEEEMEEQVSDFGDENSVEEIEQCIVENKSYDKDESVQEMSLLYIPVDKQFEFDVTFEKLVKLVENDKFIPNFAEGKEFRFTLFGLYTFDIGFKNPFELDVKVEQDPCRYDDGHWYNYLTTLYIVCGKELFLNCIRTMVWFIDLKIWDDYWKFGPQTDAVHLKFDDCLKRQPKLSRQIAESVWCNTLESSAACKLQIEFRRNLSLWVVEALKIQDDGYASVQRGSDHWYEQSDVRRNRLSVQKLVNETLT